MPESDNRKSPDGRWFTRLKPRASAGGGPATVLDGADATPRPRLFCFPYAGGGAAAFRGWADALPEADVIAVQAPGRDGRLAETPFERLDPLVEAAAAALAPVVTSDSVFFGHSLGALISFEVARALRARGAPQPRHLLFSGAAAPDARLARRPLHQLPDAAFLEGVRAFGGMVDTLAAHPELLQLFLPVLRADFAVFETREFRPGPPLDRPFTILGGRGDRWITREALEAWRAHTTGPTDVHLVDGGHFFLHEQPAAVLARVRAVLAS